MRQKKIKYNKYGVPVSYFITRFNRIHQNFTDYKPEELVRDLEKLLAVAKGEIEPTSGPEFNQ